MATLTPEVRAARIEKYTRLANEAQAELTRLESAHSTLAIDIHRLRNKLQAYQLRLYALNNGQDDRS